ncbi:MAG: histidine--tRNA ligase [Leptospirales bacterium]|nr:histidine--tRNA ligase [Leptospirales bacterium]
MALSTKPYIGSRDFYPEQMEFRNWMFGVQRQVCRSYGFEEYAAPLLEPLDLYRAKSSEEIVSEQLYRFVDRGEREVAIRPELTPSLARMVAARLQELPRPLRWFNIGNFMRYERPGRGRLREFFQLNVDLLGSTSPLADLELITLAVDLLRAYGAQPQSYQLRYSDRRLLDSWLSTVDVDMRRAIGRLIDKRDKIGGPAFEEQLQALCNDPGLCESVQQLLALKSEELPALAAAGRVDAKAAELLAWLPGELQRRGYGDECRFDPAIVRGFDYYTGFIFELYDLHPDNNRALFGGGRYDRLVGMFGKEELPAVGFGMGDVTLENFLRSRQLVPDFALRRQGAYLVMMGSELAGELGRLAFELRSAGLEAEIALESTKKLGRQLETADRKKRRFALILGEEELQKDVVRVKDFDRGDQADCPRSGLVEFLRERQAPGAARVEPKS